MYSKSVMKSIKEKGYEHYSVDINGNVYNTTKCSRYGRVLLVKPKLLKSYPNKNTGYMTVVLRNGIKAKSVYVHRLVANVYLPNPLKLPQVNHKNFDKNDNSVSNLEWVTSSQNMQHRFLHSEKKIDYVLKNELLINEGINHYEYNKDINYLSKLWDISVPKCFTILRLHNIEVSRFKLPNNIRIKVIDELKVNKLKRPKFIKYIRNKYNVDFTIHQLVFLQKHLEV